MQLVPQLGGRLAGFGNDDAVHAGLDGEGEMGLFVPSLLNVFGVGRVLFNAPAVMKARVDAADHGQKHSRQALGPSRDLDHLFDLATEEEGTGGYLFEFDLELKFKSSLVVLEVLGDSLCRVQSGRHFLDIVHIGSPDQEHDMAAETFVVDHYRLGVGDDFRHAGTVHDGKFLERLVLAGMFVLTGRRAGTAGDTGACSHIALLGGCDGGGSLVEDSNRGINHYEDEEM
mmetsp:Transcript_24273/g.39630  ORF Transcript_24273/g.39630 Transcript_24273/m.39630 type:complete len:229 (-) Transcript_24273:347-1033(-)